MQGLGLPVARRLNLCLAATWLGGLETHVPAILDMVGFVQIARAQGTNCLQV